MTKFGYAGSIAFVPRTVKVQEAKTHLSALLAGVERGEEIIIARGGVPVARLIPLEDVPQRQLGFVPYEIPSSFFDPLPETELLTWEQ